MPSGFSLPTRRKRALASVAVIAATVAASLLVATPANAADVAFADPALQACVNQRLGQPDAAPVSTTQAASITQLNCSGQGITSLEGAQALTSAWDLYFANNSLTDLTPLTGLTQITQIDIANNQISSLAPFASLTNMVYVSAGGNQISDLSPLSGLTAIKSLNLTDNNVSDLGPLSSLSQLEGLLIGSNDVSDLTPIAGLTRIAILYVDNNQVTDLGPLSGLVNIFQLFLNANEISDLGPLSSITALQDIRLQNNHIADLSPLGGLPVLAQVHAFDQTLALPDVIVGDPTANPLREPHGAVYTSVTGDANFVLAADGASWTYSAPATNSVSWNMAYPGPVWPAWEFSGTISQRSIDRPVVQNPTTLVDDTATTVNTQPVTIDVLANDGLAGEPLLDAGTLTLIDSSDNPVTQLAVAGGVFAVVNGAIVFTPTAGFAGTVDPVSYAVTNAEGLEGRAVIRVTVTAAVTPTTSPTTGTTTGQGTGAGTSGASLAITGGSADAAMIAGGLGALLVLGGAVNLMLAKRRAKLSS
ncbi:leucine-rich repeat domain-containing protein [Microbacterium sp. NPDC087665]|uniref:leucine-rich repeat domain-containing protein n=1 Tax=Microbacterium sp. NPDC087665 TaxID=3364194 RepID=UPI003810FF36